MPIRLCPAASVTEARMSVSVLDEISPHLILHIGARHGDRLPEFGATGARRIVLVEPEAGMAAGLMRNTAGQSRFRVIAAAAGAGDGRGQLTVTSLPELNSMVPSTPDLEVLYPGLRSLAPQEVDIVSPGSLLKALEPAEGPLLAVIEAPGQEMVILQAWKTADALHRIDRLELRCAEQPLHVGAEGRAAIEAWLTEEGFVLTRRDTGDPDWPVLHLRLSRAAVKLARAEARIAGLTGAEAGLKTATARVAALEKTVTQLREQVAIQAETADRNLTELRGARHDLGLALRMQTRLEGDLGDLRIRHEAALASKAEHEELLKQLTPRLREAARHLQALRPDGLPGVAGEG